MKLKTYEKKRILGRCASTKEMSLARAFFGSGARPIILQGQTVPGEERAPEGYISAIKDKKARNIPED